MLRERFWWLPFGRVPEVDARSLYEQLKHGVKLQLIDVRSPVEFRSGHIDGALNMPINHLRLVLPDLQLDPNRPVIAICATAHRSPPAVRLLRQAGFDVRQLRGGMIAWSWAKLPIVKPSGTNDE